MEVKNRFFLPRAIAELVDQEARARDTTPDELLVEVLAERFPLPIPGPLASYRQLPIGYGTSAERVYEALAAAGGAATTVELAAVLGIHRGNVDRHLSRLRADGYVRRDGRTHLIETNEKQEFQAS